MEKNSPNESLTKCRLYGILDLGYVESGNALKVARAMIAGGVDLIQLRAKDRGVREITTLARELHAITSETQVPLIINDYAQIARDVGAAGVHLGQGDLGIAEARRLLGPYGLVGKSTHSLEQAKHAAAEGADYIGFGPLFATPTKPDYHPIGLGEIASAHQLVSLPIFCIGGIKLENLSRVIAAGARRVVIVSGLLQATDIAAYARAVKVILSHNDES